MGTPGWLSIGPDGLEGFSIGAVPTGAVPLGVEVVTGTGDTMTLEVETVPFLNPY